MRYTNAGNGEIVREDRGRGEKHWEGQGRDAQGPQASKLDPIDEAVYRIIAMVSAKVEHLFRVLKRQFGHVKPRYRGLAKNPAQLFTLFALGNLFLVRRRLMA